MIKEENRMSSLPHQHRTLTTKDRSVSEDRREKFIVEIVLKGQKMLTEVTRILAPLALLAGLAGAAQAVTVFIPEGSGNEILMVDGATGQVIGRIEGLEAVHGLAGAPRVPYLIAGSYAEIAADEAVSIPNPEGVTADEHAAHHAKPAVGAMPKDAGRSILTVLDVASGSVVRRIDVPGAVHHNAVSPDGRFAAATHPAGDGISVIDLETLSFKAFIPTGSTPNYAIFSRDGGTIYVSNTGNGTISEVDVAKGIVKRNILAGESPEHIVLSRDGSTLYAVDADAGQVLEIALSSGAILRSFQIGGELHGMDLSEDSATLFVSGKGENKIAAIDLSSGSVRSASLGPAPYHLTTVTGTGKIYVSSRDEPKVWVVDPVTLSATAEIAVVGEGHQMVVLP
jgi:YVTN family beta-propeller protein